MAGHSVLKFWQMSCASNLGRQTVTPSNNPTEWLFSYGTLQHEAVQKATFGRLLRGELDALAGYWLEWIEIRDDAVVTTSGKTHHLIATRTDLVSDRIGGSVFAVTAAELAQADAYEVDDY